jgi:hypothetical protein
VQGLLAVYTNLGTGEKANVLLTRDDVAQTSMDIVDVSEYVG